MLSSLLKIEVLCLSIWLLRQGLRNIQSDYYDFLFSCMLFNLMEIILLHLCVLNENVSSLLKQITFESLLLSKNIRRGSYEHCKKIKIDVSKQF